MRCAQPKTGPVFKVLCNTMPVFFFAVDFTGVRNPRFLKHNLLVSFHPSRLAHNHKTMKEICKTVIYDCLY